MTDLSEILDFDSSFSLSSFDEFNEQQQVEPIANVSIDGNSTSFRRDFNFGTDPMRVLFVAIGTITILVCLTICVSACLCICLNRHRSRKRQEPKDHRLLPEQSEKIVSKKSSLTNPIHKTSIVNGKQQLEKVFVSSITENSSSYTISGKTPIKSYYYENLDDIPFIDESRPTSFIDITRV